MKIVYGDCYFATAAISDAPPELKDLYRRALACLSEPFHHNLVKISRDRKSVTLCFYPALETSPHPYLSESCRIVLADSGAPRFRRESKDNPVILHRLEEMLEKNNPRIPVLRRLTQKEEELGMYTSSHSRLIGRRSYWNALCEKVGLKESRVLW